MTRIEAVALIIDWDAATNSMVVLNPGDVAEVSDVLAGKLLETGEAKKTKKALRVAEADDAEPEFAPVDEQPVATVADDDTAADEPPAE